MRDIKIVQELRTCYVEDKKALFHGWFPFGRVKDGQVLNYVLGLVEYVDGKVDLIVPGKIQFADGGEFHDRFWFPKEVLNNAELKR